MTLLIHNVTLIDGSGRAPRPHMEVLIGGDCFAAIRPSGTDKAATTVIDGHGGYLLPGLWEGHIHVTGGPATGVSFGERAARAEHVLAEYLQAGVTTLLDLGGPLDLLCTVRDRQAAAPARTPELLFSGQLFTGIDGWPVRGRSDHSMAFEVGDPETARRLVEQHAPQIDFIKCIYDGEPGTPHRLSRPVLTAIVAAAHAAGRKVLVHVKTGDDLVEAVEAGADGIEHAFVPRDAQDLGEAEAVAALLARAGVYFCPTLVTWEQFGRARDLNYLRELVQDHIIAEGDVAGIAARLVFNRPSHAHPADESLACFKYGTRCIPIFHAAGVKLSVGTDVPMFMARRSGGLRRELQLLTRAGLPLMDLIVAATRHNAEKVGRMPGAGTISVGAPADALLLSADPLKDVSALIHPNHHVATVRRGELVTPGPQTPVRG